MPQASARGIRTGPCLGGFPTRLYTGRTSSCIRVCQSPSTRPPLSQGGRKCAADLITAIVLSSGAGMYGGREGHSEHIADTFSGVADSLADIVADNEGCAKDIADDFAHIVADNFSGIIADNVSDDFGAPKTLPTSLRRQRLLHRRRQPQHN